MTVISCPQFSSLISYQKLFIGCWTMPHEQTFCIPATTHGLWRLLANSVRRTTPLLLQKPAVVFVILHNLCTVKVKVDVLL